jgi:hypothetical protein
MMYAVGFTADGRRFLAGGTDTQLRQWDAVKVPKDPETIYKWPAPYGMSAMATSPDGRWLAAYGPGYHIHLIDLATHKKVKEWILGEQFGGLAFAPDSRHLAIGVSTGVTIVLRLEGPKLGG